MRELIVCLPLVLFGCGGDGGSVEGSGVDGTLALGTLAADDVDAVCDYGVELSRVVVCNDRDVESVTTFDACLDLFASFGEACDATVADIEACFEDLAADSDDEVCDLSSPPSCAFFGDPDCIDL